MEILIGLNLQYLPLIPTSHDYWNTVTSRSGLSLLVHAGILNQEEHPLEHVIIEGHLLFDFEVFVGEQRNQYGLLHPITLLVDGEEYLDCRHCLLELADQFLLVEIGLPSGVEQNHAGPVHDLLNMHVSLLEAIQEIVEIVDIVRGVNLQTIWFFCPPCGASRSRPVWPGLLWFYTL